MPLPPEKGLGRSLARTVNACAPDSSIVRDVSATRSELPRGKNRSTEAVWHTICGLSGGRHVDKTAWVGRDRRACQIAEVASLGLPVGFVLVDMWRIGQSHLVGSIGPHPDEICTLILRVRRRSPDDARSVGRPRGRPIDPL